MLYYTDIKQLQAKMESTQEECGRALKAERAANQTYILTRSASAEGRSKRALAARDAAYAAYWTAHNEWLTA